MKSFSKFITQVSFLSSIIALSLGINYLSAWIGPTALPPNNNIATPLNVSQTPQVKDGNVSVGKSTNIATDLGLSVYGGAKITGGFAAPSVTLGSDPLATVGAYSQPGEGGVIDLRGSNNMHMFLESLNGKFRLINSPWTAEIFSVDQSGNMNAAGKITTSSGGVQFPDGTVQTTAFTSTNTGAPPFLVNVLSDDCGWSHPYLGCPTGYRAAGSFHPGQSGFYCDGNARGIGYDNGNVSSGWMVLCSKY